LTAPPSGDARSFAVMTSEPATAPSEDLAFAGLVGQLDLLGAGEASSRELVDLSLARIDATQATLNSFRRVRAEAARDAADDADRRRAAGERAPLLGVPVAIKDDTDLEGETTPFGCAGEFQPKSEDGEVVRRLKHAGAVIVGKTTTPEFGQWPITEGRAFGVTRNPWSPQHTPGGSSGGSAAAVAAGLVPAALGSDGLGSIRVPAAWCHLVGIKPQRGRVSTWPYTDAFHGLTCIGPLARSVADAALLLDAVAGNHPADPDQPPHPSEPFLAAARRADPGRPLRVALSFKIPFSVAPAQLDPEVRAMIESFAARLESLGHDVQRAEPTYGIFGAGVLARSSAGLLPWIGSVSDPSSLDPRTRHNAQLGRLVGGPLLRAARALERPARRQIGAIFRNFDVVLTPTTAQPPLPVGAIDGLSNWQTDRVVVGACPYNWPWNVLGWPAMSVPAGLTKAGLPIGAQLLAGANQEAELIGLAAQLEQAEVWTARRPPATIHSPPSGPTPDGEDADDNGS
jgi:amidase